MTCHLHIGDGVKNDQPLEKLAGRVVEYKDSPFLEGVFFVTKDKKLDLDGCEYITIARMDKSGRKVGVRVDSVPDLDHGPISLADAAPCRPEVSVLYNTVRRKHEIRINGDFICTTDDVDDAEDAEILKIRIIRTLSHLPTRAQVRAEAIEQSAKMIEKLGYEGIADDFRREMAFNLPAPPHASEGEPDKLDINKVMQEAAEKLGLSQPRPKGGVIFDGCPHCKPVFGDQTTPAEPAPVTVEDLLDAIPEVIGSHGNQHVTGILLHLRELTYSKANKRAAARNGGGA